MRAQDEVDRLYGLPLEDFVAQRDLLARRLRVEGDRDTAAEVKRLAKPTRAAWAVNRLVRERPEEIRALVDAGEALAGAQDELLAGGDAEALRRAVEAARALIDGLVSMADVEGAAREKVRATLHAATVDPDVRAEVAAGRVVRERVAAGFGGLETALAGSAGARRAPARRRSSKPGAKPPADPASERRRRDELRRAKEAEAAAGEAVAGARRALEQVETTLVARQAELDRAETALDQARRRRERAERAAG